MVHTHANLVAAIQSLEITLELWATHLGRPA